MKKLVLLLMLFGVARSFGAVATNVQNLSQFGTTNRAMPGDGIGLSTRYATGSERLMGIQVTNLIRSLNALGVGTNTVILSEGTNIVIVATRTSSNVTYVISTSNNVSLVDVTNIIAAATNGFTSVSPPLSSVQYNSNGVQSGSSLFVFTNNNVGIGTNAPVYPLSLHQSDISEPALNISYDTGAGNTIAVQIQNGTGATNIKFDVAGNAFLNGANVSGTTTSDVATVTSLNVKGGTLGAGKVLTDTGGTGAATWQDPSVSLGAITNIVTNYVSAILQSNFVNLSVQAAKPIESTNFPPIESGFKNWEAVYYKTNIFGTTANLGANWQFIVPPDYSTNTLQVYLTCMLLQTTNGPNTSNTIFRASIFKATPGDSVDVHMDAFGAQVAGTNDWAASNTGTNKTQSLLINLSTNSLLQAGDLAVLNLERNSTNDTYIGAVGLTGLQLWYKRKN